MSTRFATPVMLSVDDKGVSDPAASLTFYEPGSGTVFKDTFTDSTDTTANGNPMFADGKGQFTDIFGTGLYRVVFKDSDGVQQWARDNVLFPT